MDDLVSAIKSTNLWPEITKRQDTKGSPHKYTKAIFLRWCQSQEIEAAFTDIEAIDYPAFEKLPEARPLVDLVLEATGATKLGRVLIVELEPGAMITPHVDEGDVADYYERFHIALTSDVGNDFFCAHDSQSGEFVHMMPGEMWWFNHKKEHYLINSSNKPRWHLIIDAVAPKYRRERQ